MPLSNYRIMGDVLFTTIEKFHGAKLWGRVLDAGTGLHSMKWIQKIPTTSWTAITADNNMRNQVLKDASVAANMRPMDSIVVGNWMDQLFTETLGSYDTILADYLIGAVDGFSPYQQDEIIGKLKKHLNPNGRLYIIGMSPIPDDPAPPGNIISEIRRARDSCILLAGHRPYREFPLDWMRRHLEAAKFSIVGSKNFTILHSEESAVRQIKVAQSKLPLIKNIDLKKGTEKYLTDLESRARSAIRAAGGKIPLSFDYVLAVEHILEQQQLLNTLAADASSSLAAGNNNNNNINNSSSSSSSSSSSLLGGGISSAGTGSTMGTTGANCITAPPPPPLHPAKDAGAST